MIEPSSQPSPPDPWATSLGIRVLDAAPGRVVLEMPLEGEHMNFLDRTHGGALFSLAEAAIRTAAGIDGPSPVLLDAHLALTAGGRQGDVFTAEVTPVNVGRTLGVYRVVVVRGDGRTVGELTGTVRFRT